MASKIPVLRGSSPRSLPPARRSVSDAKVKWSTLDGGKLAELFPSFSISDRRSVSLSGGMQRVERVFFTPADQIQKRIFEKEEIEKVKTLALHRIEIADDQIEALVSRFYEIETVVFNEVFQITEIALNALRSLKKLKNVQIKSCPNIKRLDDLPLEQLEKIQTALAFHVGIDVSRRLASSPVLREADLGSLAQLQKEELLCFKVAHELHPIKIQVNGSLQITSDVVRRLNQGRKIPVCVEGLAAFPERPDPRKVPRISAADLTVPVHMTNREFVGWIERQKRHIRAASVYGCEELTMRGLFISMSLCV